jgi:FKBP-type peptidyl-prolyl cis-trans isomerase SlyD
MSIQNGSKVSIHYRLIVDDQVVDSSEGKDPLSYEHGAGQIIPGLEKQLEGMDTGDKKKVTVSPEEGYGHHDPAQIQKVPINAFAEPDKLEVGATVKGQAGDQMFSATIVELSKEEVTLDTNHPLAGKELNFEIEIVEVE